MIIPGFKTKGGISTVVNGYQNSELEEKYDITYIETYCDGNKIKKTCKAIKAYTSFLCYLMKNNPDIIHIHSSFGASFYRKMPFIIIADFFNIKIVNHIHGSEIRRFYIDASLLKRKLIEFIYNKCDNLICLSQEWKENFKVIHLKSNISVVENYSIYPSDFYAKRKGTKKVLYLGFITKLKGCFDIPYVIEKVVQIIPDINFIIAGSGQIEELKKKINEMGLTKYTLFPGWVGSEKKDELLREADLFFLPSYSEGMPMSILEAMGYRLPVVASLVGGIPQLIEDNINGFLVTPGNINGYADAIIKILKDDILKEDMGMNSFLISKKKFSKDTHLEKIMYIYESILKKKSI